MARIATVRKWEYIRKEYQKEIEKIAAKNLAQFEKDVADLRIRLLDKVVAANTPGKED